MIDLKTNSNASDIIVENGDFVLVDDADEVGQAISHALRLWKGEWRADTRRGTDYRGRILGKSSRVVRDAEIRAQISGVAGVREIQRYVATFDRAQRILTISAKVLTIYGNVVDVLEEL